MKKITIPLILAYIAAIAAANLLVTQFGPWTSPVVDFFLIGFVFVARDVLSEVWRGRKTRFIMMIGVILLAGVSAYLVNPDSKQIAIASTVAFIVSETIDWAVYVLLDKYPFLIRSNGSNIFGNASDTIVFNLVAFGVIPQVGLIMIVQFIAKFAGGFLWSMVIEKTLNPDKRRAKLTKQRS